MASRVLRWAVAVLRLNVGWLGVEVALASLVAVGPVVQRDRLWIPIIGYGVMAVIGALWVGRVMPMWLGVAIQAIVFGTTLVAFYDPEHDSLATSMLLVVVSTVGLGITAFGQIDEELRENGWPPCFWTRGGGGETRPSAGDDNESVHSGLEKGRCSGRSDGHGRE